MESPPARLRWKEQLRTARRELILQVAEGVFEEKGYYETTMDEIAARSGLAKGTLYQHFPGKDELIAALFERNLSLFEQAVAQAASAAVTARGKLEHILRYVYLERSGLHARLLQLISYGGAMRETLQARLRDRLERLMVQIRQILQEGQEQGEFRLSLSSEVMLLTFMRMLLFTKYEPLLSRQALSPEELAAQVARLFFDGIATSKDIERS
jgi:AcrR family transcriptional regulator